MVMALITLVSIYLAPETYRRDLKHIQDENQAIQVELLRKICTAISAGNLYLPLYNLNPATKPTQRKESLLWNRL